MLVLFDFFSGIVTYIKHDLVLMYEAGFFDLLVHAPYLLDLFLIFNS